MRPKLPTAPRVPLPARGRSLFVLLLLALCAVSLAGPAAYAQPADGQPITSRSFAEDMPALPVDQIIIKFAPATDPARLSAAGEGLLMDRLSRAAGVPLRVARPMSGDAYVLQLPGRMPEAEAARISLDLAAQPGVVYAEPNSIMLPVGRPTQAARPQSIDQEPDDLSFINQWHYRYTSGVEEGLNLPPAWNISTGSSDIVVAVLDTGILPHADLAGRTVPGYDFVDSIPSANDGDGPDPDPTDPGDWSDVGQCGIGWPGYLPSSWHGTHVAGTIGAASNNGSDVAGVDWNARILPVRVLGSCGGTVSDIANAIRWSAGLPVPGAPPNPNPADVINLSLGGMGTCSLAYQEAFNAVDSAGVTVIVAAGNSNSNVIGFRPANCQKVISVAATNREGRRSYYSNYGGSIEISAPGGETIFDETEGVLSTFNDGLTGAGNDSLHYYQGTSMAAPHVAGLASLILSVRPDLTPDELLDVLQSTARAFPDGSNCNTSLCGPGIADAFAALSALETTLDAPALIAPAGGAVLTTATPTFEWSAVDGAAEYRLQVATDAAFNNVVLATGGLNTTTHTPAAPLPEGDYWWRVRAEAAETGPWSQTRLFTIDLPAVCQPPDAPVLTAPADGGTSDILRPTFLWEPAAHATGYEFRLGEATDVSDAPVVGLPTAATFTPDAPLVAGTTYYWKVRARNVSDDCDLISGWSEVWSVTIDEAATGDHYYFLPAVKAE